MENKKMLLSEIIEKLTKLKQSNGDVEISYLYQYHYDIHGKFLFGHNDQSKIQIYEDVEIGQTIECFKDTPQFNSHQYYLNFKQRDFGRCLTAIQ